MHGHATGRRIPGSWWAVLLAVAPLVVVLLAGSVDSAAADERTGPFRDALEGPLGPVSRGDEAPVRPALPRLLTLREAATEGLVKAVGFQPRSYRQVHLRLTNRTEEPLRIDVCGSHLVPRRKGSCQRLGIGPVVTPRGKKRTPDRRHPRPPDQPPGTVIIGLKGGEEKVIHLNTCCLDSGKPAPRTQKFSVARSELPEVRVQALRWWADNPTAPQGVVNRAIWQFRPIDPLLAFEGGRSGGSPRVLGGTGVAVHAGTLYRLEAGELMARDPDGIERFLGTQIESVHPTDSAIYAVSWGSNGTSTSAGTSLVRELWRLVPTGDEPWAHVATLRHGWMIRRVHVAPNGGVLVITNTGLWRLDRSAKILRPVFEVKPDGVEHLSVGFLKNGTAQVTHRRPGGEGYFQGGERKGESMPVCELWHVDAKTGEKKHIRDFWNVRQVQCGPAGTYALTPGGKLRRMAGRSFRNAPGQLEYDRIVYVGRKHVWLESKKARLVAVDKAGRIRFEAGPRMPDDGAWAVDAHDDRAVWRERNDVYRIEPSRGKREKLPNPADER